MIDFLRKKCKHITRKGRKVRRPREKYTSKQYDHILPIPLLSHHCAGCSRTLLFLPSGNMNYLPIYAITATPTLMIIGERTVTIKLIVRVKRGQQKQLY